MMGSLGFVCSWEGLWDTQWAQVVCSALQLTLKAFTPLLGCISGQLFLAVPSVLCSGLRRLWQGTEAISEPCRTHQELPFLNLVFAAVLEESLIPGSCQEKSPILRSEGQESQGK